MNPIEESRTSIWFGNFDGQAFSWHGGWRPSQCETTGKTKPHGSVVVDWGGLWLSPNLPWFIIHNQYHQHPSTFRFSRNCAQSRVFVSLRTLRCIPAPAHLWSMQHVAWNMPWISRLGNYLGQLAWNLTQGITFSAREKTWGGAGGVLMHRQAWVKGSSYGCQQPTDRATKDSREIWCRPRVSHPFALLRISKCGCTVDRNIDFDKVCLPPNIRITNGFPKLFQQVSRVIKWVVFFFQVWFSQEEWHWNVF